MGQHQKVMYFVNFQTQNLFWKLQILQVHKYTKVNEYEKVNEHLAQCLDGFKPCKRQTHFYGNTFAELKRK